MFSDLRFAAIAVFLTIALAGGLIAAAVISATSGGPLPPQTTPSAMAVATRSLPAYWTVHPGDTFTTIATQNHLSVDQLQQLNPAQDPTNLIPGRRLRLRVREPGRPIAARRVVPALWTVARGDTYSSIAAKTGVALGDIAQFNPKVNPNLLVPGRRLRLRP